jgi:hypothetical protein
MPVAIDFVDPEQESKYVAHIRVPAYYYFSR